jgi:hypothetical protein
VEFARLNFDFHPRAIRDCLVELGFAIEKTLTLSHFRVGVLKRIVPTGLLVFFDSLLQWTGEWWQLTPSVFVKSRLSAGGQGRPDVPVEFISMFKCPDCGGHPLKDKGVYLECSGCRKRWEVKDGIYDFREPMK